MRSRCHRLFGVLPILVLSIVLGSSGCAERPRTRVGADPTSRPPETATPSSETQEVREEPYALELEGPQAASPDVEFEEDALEPPEEVGGASFEQSNVSSETFDEELPDVQPQQVEVPVPATVQTPVEPTSTDPVPQTETRGFRIQLAAASAAAEADQLAREARTRLGVEVHVQFETPWYKVRAGDFVDRAAALQLRDRARRLGYPRAWLVTTTIRR